MVRLNLKDKPTAISFLVLTGLFLTVIFQSVNLDSRTGLATESLNLIYEVNTIPSISGYDTTITFTEPYSGAIIVDGKRTEVIDETQVTVTTDTQPQNLDFQPSNIVQIIPGDIVSNAVTFSNTCKDITAPDTYLLSADLFDTSFSNGNCISILTDNVIFDCQQNSVYGNTAGTAFFVSGTNVTIRNCVIDSMGTGIFFSSTSNNFVYDNNITNSNNAAIIIYNSQANKIDTNFLTDNNRGIILDSLDANSENNIIYNNYFSNDINVEFRSGEYSNVWTQLTNQGAQNIIGTSGIRGNYWGTTSNNGYSEDASLCTDWDNNKICDVAYVINPTNQDIYPLTFIPQPIMGNLSVEPITCSHLQTCEYNLTTDGFFDPQTSTIFLTNVSNSALYGVYTRAAGELIISDKKITLIGDKLAVGETSLSVIDRRGTFVVPQTVTVTGPAVCGNNIIEFPETCDDGNVLSGDGCSATCFIEVTPVTVSSVNPLSCDTETGCVITLTLSDSLNWNAGEETIITITDVSNNQLVYAYEPDIIIPDYLILPQNITSGGSQVRLAIPQNVFEVGPTNITFEDRTTNSNDVYNSFSITTSIIPAFCGDGLINQVGETCDDGNTVSGDGCSNSCTLETGFICTGEPSTCSISACGATISRPGFYFLYNDVNTAGSNCLQITSDDVYLDCQYNIISSQARNSGTAYYSGITALGNNVTLDSCILDGFYYNINGGGDDLFTTNSFSNNGAYGFYYVNNLGNFESTNDDITSNDNGYYISGNGVITNSNVSNSLNTYLTVEGGGNLVLNNLYAENNRPIRYYNSPVILSQTDIGNAISIVLFNAADSQLNNLQMAGAGSAAAIVASNTNNLEINGGLYTGYSRGAILKGANILVNGVTFKDLVNYGIIASFETNGLMIRESSFENIGSYSILSWKPSSAQNYFINNNTFNSSTNNYFFLTTGTGPNPAINFDYNTWLLANGNGFSESSSCVDNGFDGICDFSYTVSGSYVDTKPRVYNFIPPPTCSENSLYNLPCSAGINECAQNGVYSCQDPNSYTEVPVCNAQPLDPVTEICGDGLDNNCDGSFDEGCAAQLTISPTPNSCDSANDCTITFDTNLPFDDTEGYFVEISDGISNRIWGYGNVQFTYPITKINNSRFSIVIPAGLFEPSTASVTLSVEATQEIASTQLTITYTAPVCGNNVREGQEVCDGTDLSGNSCSSLNLGFNSGNLSCSSDCASYDTNQCTTLQEIAVSCGDYINNPGVYVLEEDQTSQSNCLFINSSDVVLDCQNHLIIGSQTADAIRIRNDAIKLSNIEVRNCRITNFSRGIYVSGEVDILIYDNEIANAQDTAIFLVGSNNSRIYNNTLSDSIRGIDAYDITQNHIFDNVIRNNELGASVSFDSNKNFFYSNLLTLNTRGLIIESAQSNDVYNNLFTLNSQNSIQIKSHGNGNAVSNIIRSNRVVLSNNAILLDQAASGAVNNNIIYDNFFNSTENVDLSGAVGPNNWSISPIEGNSIISTDYLGGNFYARPLSNGFSETCIPAFDGFCFGANVHFSANADYYPLTLKPYPNLLSVNPEVKHALGGYDIILDIQNFNTTYNITLLNNNYSLSGINSSPYSIVEGKVKINIPFDENRTETTPFINIHTPRITVGSSSGSSGGAEKRILVLSDEIIYGKAGLFKLSSPIRIMSANPATITQGFNNPLNIIFTVENYENEDLNWSPEFNISFANLVFKNGTLGGNNYSYNGRTVTIQIPPGEYPNGDVPVYVIDDVGYAINSGLVSFISPPACDDCDGISSSSGSSSGSSGRGGTTRAQERTFEDPDGFNDIIRVVVDYLSPYLLKLEIRDAPDSEYTGEGILYNVYEFEANRNSEEITEGRITFEVNSVWMKNNNIDPNSISMYRKSEGERRWTKLSTIKNPSGTYTAYTDRFSLFAVVSSNTAQEKEEEEEIEIINREDKREENLPPPVFEEEESNKIMLYVWAGIAALIIVLIVITLLLIKKHTKVPDKKTPPEFSNHETPTSLYGQKPLIIPAQNRPVIKKVVKKQLKDVDKKPALEGHVPTSQEISQLKAYVDACLNKGFNLLRIRNKLISAGWNKEAIDHLVVQENQEFIKKKKNNKEDLKHYVGICRQKNISDDRIKLVLQKAGWKEQDIEEALTSTFNASSEKTL